MSSSRAFNYEYPSPTDTDSVAALCKAAGDPLRMQILKVLQQNAYGVLELCAVFDIRQPAMSHHLKILAGASLVTTRREGTSIFYCRNEANPDSDLQKLQRSLFQTIDLAALDLIYSNRLTAINTDRSAASVAFFDQNAHRFEQNQDLIAGWSDYGESLEEFLPKHIAGCDSALEIGPGYGHFLSALSSQFKQVTAVDNSLVMLDQCKTRAVAQNLENVTFFLGDTQATAIQKKTFDFVSLNMVLHHNPVPADIIADCARLLKENGILIITDLCVHDQEWTKTSCGDMWLGFEPEAITRWARSAGLTEGDSLYLTQRNGFRIQLRQFSLKFS
jgi:ArsR family transcriptional regulator